MRPPSPVRLFLPMAVAALLLLAACADQNASPGASPNASAFDSSAVQKDTTFNASLAQILQRQERFRVFTTLLDSAGLLPALQHGGPYTVFAATSPGIEKLPDGLVDELLLPANRDRLRQVMRYHLHQGQLQKRDLRDTSSISTLTGQPLPIAVEGGRVMIGEGRVSEYALTGSNGRIFAFDALAIPPVGGATGGAVPDLGAYDSLGTDNGSDSGAGTDASPDADGPEAAGENGS